MSAGPGRRPWRRVPDRPAPRPGSSMALLEEVLDRPPDPGYQTAAEVRERQGLAPSTGTRTVLMAVTAVVLGFVLATAARELRTPDPASAATREQLVVRVQQEQESVQRYAAEAEELRTRNEQLEARALDGSLDDPRDDLSAVGTLAGATEMTGPGVVLTLEDRPRAPGVEGPADPSERVLAQDVQRIVNDLWAHGAEAVAVNDHRLTATSAIRFAGEAIIVDFRALTPPYVVRAIGDPTGLAEGLDSGATGAYLAELRADYGIIARVSQEESVTVPAGGRLSTRLAGVPETTEGAS